MNLAMIETRPVRLFVSYSHQDNVWFKRLQPLLTVSGEFADSPDVRWSVYRHLSTDQRGVILANLSGAPIELEDIALEDAQGTCRIIQPFEPERSSQWPAAVRIPAERVAFLVEGAK